MDVVAKLCVVCRSAPIAFIPGNSSYCDACLKEKKRQYRWKKKGLWDTTVVQKVCALSADSAKKANAADKLKRMIAHSVRIDIAKRICRSHRINFDDAPADWLDEKLKKYGY